MHTVILFYIMVVGNYPIHQQRLTCILMIEFFITVGPEYKWLKFLMQFDYFLLFPIYIYIDTVNCFLFNHTKIRGPLSTYASLALLFGPAPGTSFLAPCVAWLPCHDMSTKKFDWCSENYTFINESADFHLFSRIRMNCGRILTQCYILSKKIHDVKKKTWILILVRNQYSGVF